VLAGKGGVHSEKKLWIKRVIHNVGVGGDSVGIHFHVAFFTLDGVFAALNLKLNENFA